MMWWEWLLMIAVVLAFVAIMVLTMTLKRQQEAISELTERFDDLRKQTMPVLADTRSALRRVEGNSRRADALIDTATALTGRADSATKLAYSVVGNPIVRLLAFFTGTKRTADRLRGKSK